MLLQFNFKNFMSFRDDTTLDMTAAPVTELGHHLVTVGREKVLPVAAIFGANAGGKSNFIEAIKYMNRFVLFSFGFGDEDSEINKGRGFIAPTPFLFDAKSKDAESVFEVFFVTPEESGARLYNYGFSVNSEGVQEEWLNDRAKSSRSDYKRIFYRKGDELDMPGIPIRSQENIRVAIEKKTLIVSLGAKLKITILKFIRDWFLGNQFADFGRPLQTFFLSTRLPKDFTTDKEVQDRVVQYFSSFDSSIVGFETDEIEAEDGQEGKKKVKINAIHNMVDSNEKVAIPLVNESAGTLKMFALFPLLEFVLKSGGVLFVDELNARLHPLLLRTFVLIFLNPELNKNHAQLIFTTHDAWQLNNELFRRDEIWFAEKSQEAVSTLYSLSDFILDDKVKIRKDENYEKNYLLGKYGAIPSMEHFKVLREE